MGYFDRQGWIRLGGAVACVLMSSATHAAIIAHYKFDETAATSAFNEISDNGGNGAIGTNVTQGATGVDGTAFTFSGGAAQGDIVDMANATGIFGKMNASGQVTVSYWVKSADTGNRNVAVFLGNGSDNNDYLDSGILGNMQFAPAGTAYARNRKNTDTVGNIGDIGGGTVVTDGQFHHIVFSVDTVADTATFYVDGAQIASTTSTVKFGAFPTFNNFEVGRLGRGGSQTPTDGLSGTIDDLQLYDNILSLAQVQFLFNNPGQVVPEPATWALVAAAIGLVAVRRSVRP